MEVGDRLLPKWGYSIVGLDPDVTAKASGRELRISPKHAREVCVAIKGMKLDQAREFLEQVINKKKPVPFKRFNKKVPHRRGLQKAAAGRYPVKAAKKILEVLESAEANATYKGLDTENLKVIHAAAYPGMKIKRYIPRAMGRATPRFETLCHVEIVLGQVGGTKLNCLLSSIS
ncbi:50S ribosomal protein L22 [Candidatus Bathyarchaeota archaeon]|nr:MAG: 50S ribosomal protein L22 [Candidatus Bathyarchaeota archaeon]